MSKGGTAGPVTGKEGGRFHLETRGEDLKVGWGGGFATVKVRRKEGWVGNSDNAIREKEGQIREILLWQANRGG